MTEVVSITGGEVSWWLRLLLRAFEQVTRIVSSCLFADFNVAHRTRECVLSAVLLLLAKLHSNHGVLPLQNHRQLCSQVSYCDAKC